MYVKINQLYINTNNIFSICPYVIENEKQYEYGFILNGVKHALFIGVPNEDGSHQQNKQKLVQLLEFLVTSHEKIQEVQINNV